MSLWLGEDPFSYPSREYVRRVVESQLMGTGPQGHWPAAADQKLGAAFCLDRMAAWTLLIRDSPSQSSPPKVANEQTHIVRGR
jgi:hypothetical protein